MYQVINISGQAVAANGVTVWFTGTKEECEYQLPRIEAYASGHNIWAIGCPQVTTNRLSGEFKIVKA